VSREAPNLISIVIVFSFLVLQALLDSQNRLSHSIEGFHFNLGFSGKYFHHGSAEENAGDDMLIGTGHKYKHICTV
jgi:hypothetical protein